MASVGPAWSAEALGKFNWTADARKDMLHVDDKSWTPEKPVRLAVGKHKLTFLVPQPPV